MLQGNEDRLDVRLTSIVTTNNNTNSQGTALTATTAQPRQLKVLIPGVQSRLA